jgi:hypothetical protein
MYMSDGNILVEYMDGKTDILGKAQVINKQETYVQGQQMPPGHFAVYNQYLNTDGELVLQGNNKKKFIVSWAAGQMGLTEPADTSTPLADTDYKLSGTFTDGGQNNKFITSSSGTLTYTGVGGKFHFVGSTDVTIDKNCGMALVLYKNGSPTPTVGRHSFNNANETANISATGLLTLDKGDEFEVYVQCDTASTTFTFNSLNITMVEI